MRRTLMATLLALVVVACSNDDPVQPQNQASERPVIRDQYFYYYQDSPIYFDTAIDRLAIKFHEGISEERIDRFLDARGWKVYGFEPSHEIWMVLVENALDVVKRVSWPNPSLEYIGPVLESGLCDGLQLHMTPTNEISVRGDVTDAEVAEHLKGAGVIRTREDRDRTILEMPWDATRTIDLANWLAVHPATEYATPNFIQQFCR